MYDRSSLNGQNYVSILNVDIGQLYVPVVFVSGCLCGSFDTFQVIIMARNVISTVLVLAGQHLKRKLSILLKLLYGNQADA